jgi:hypothetical protein
MTFLFDWISLFFMGFVFIISSLVILYSDDYMFGDMNIIRFILLVLMFVVSIMFLIQILQKFGGRDSAVGIATRYGLDVPGIEFQWVRDFRHPSRPTLAPT